jgi:hypothetical protein
MQAREFVDAMHSDSFLKLLSKRDIPGGAGVEGLLIAMKTPAIAQQFAALDLKPQYAVLLSALNAELGVALTSVDLIRTFHDTELLDALSNVQLHNLLTTPRS